MYLIHCKCTAGLRSCLFYPFLSASPFLLYWLFFFLSKPLTFLLSHSFPFCPVLFCCPVLLLLCSFVALFFSFRWPIPVLLLLRSSFFYLHTPSILAFLLPGWGILSFIPIHFIFFVIWMGISSLSYPSTPALLLYGWGYPLFHTHPLHLFCYMDGGILSFIPIRFSIFVIRMGYPFFHTHPLQHFYYPDGG